MKPLENYHDDRWRGRPPVFVGYNAVDSGWHLILAALDVVLENIIENARANATKALPEYREEGNTAEADIEVLQIKEKFGGLRVYLKPQGMSPRFAAEVHGAVMMAEVMANRTCERCGETENVVNRVPERSKPYGRTLTLCGECHEKRDQEEKYALRLPG